MTERQQRERTHDQRPPSLHMRRLLRYAFFEVHRLLRVFRDRSDIRRDEATETLRALALCRRALSRDGVPAWLRQLAAGPPDLASAVAALSLARDRLTALDIVWDRRLIAAGIDPRWPDGDA